MNIVTRKEALEKNITHYFTGKFCKHGHRARRVTGGGKCVECGASKESNEASRQWKQRNKDRKRISDKKWAESNKEIKAKSGREWYVNNKNKHLENCRNNKAIYLKNNPEYRLKCAMRGMLRRTIMGKAGRSSDILGYTSRDLINHIERQFRKGMSWENHGEWHIDHIMPISALLKSGVKDPKKINCLSNLRPIWAQENLSKSCKVEFLI